MIAEQAGDLRSRRRERCTACTAAPADRRVPRVAAEGDAERSREDHLVGRHPVEPGGRDQGHHGVGHRAFGRPEPGGPRAEQPLVTGDGPIELLPRVLGVDETVARRPRVRMRALVDLGVAQERQNRVIERRRRQLDLAARRRLAVGGNDRVQQLELDAAQDMLVLLGE